VRWAPGQARVRVTPQLIRVSDDSQLWTGLYDRPLDEVFEVQAEVAGAVVDALNLSLSAPERRALAGPLSVDPAAYDSYLRGLAHLSSPDWWVQRAPLELAVSMLERAVELDPGFVPALARLSEAHTGLYWAHDRASEARRQEAKAYAERAVALDPDSGEAHRALGLFYYQGLREYERALAELELAVRLLPGDAETVGLIGAVYRRQARFEEALPYFERAAAMAPRDPRAAQQLADTHLYMGRFHDAERWCRRGIELAPDQAYSYVLLHLVLLYGGDVARAGASLEIFPDKSQPHYHGALYEQALYERRWGDAFALLSGEPRPYDVAETAFEACRLRLLMQDVAGGRIACATAAEVWEARVADAPLDSDARTGVACAYAGLGRKEEAIAQARRGVELMPMERDHVVGFWARYYLAAVLGFVDEREAALDEIEGMMRSFPGFSRQRLRVDPTFDRLRDHPGFQALVDSDP